MNNNLEVREQSFGIKNKKQSHIITQASSKNVKLISSPNMFTDEFV